MLNSLFVSGCRTVCLMQLPEEVQVQMRATAEALQKQHRQRVKELKRQRFIRAKKALYSKLKFYGRRDPSGLLSG